jgi:hypothetical protein
VKNLDISVVRSTLLPLLLPIWFLSYAALTFFHLATHNYLAIDVTIYRHAAEMALSGGDPWTVDPNGSFAGPPATLLFYLPAAMLPLPLATLLMMSAGLAAAAWAVHRLRLPLWWVLFPPLFDALLAGNPDALVLAFLLVKGPLAGLAAVFKVYAFVPLLLQRRWPAVGLAVVVSALSLPLLSTFLANFDSVGRTLAGGAKLSAWGTWLIVPVVAALWSLRNRGAEWLIVPAVWPNTQGHYGTMSLPAVRDYPLAAALIGLDIPLVPPLAVMLIAVQDRLRRRQKAVDPPVAASDVRHRGEAYRPARPSER